MLGIGITVSLYFQRAPPDDQRCVVSLQTIHTIRYIYTIVSGQYYCADWRECNVFRETVPPYIFFRIVPLKGCWWTSRCLEYVRRLSSPPNVLIMWLLHTDRVQSKRAPCTDDFKCLNFLELTRSSRHGCFAHWISFYLNKRVTKQYHITQRDGEVCVCSSCPLSTLTRRKVYVHCPP